MGLYRTLVGHTNRRDYWSNSKLSKFIQKKAGFKPSPPAATFREWDDLEAHNKDINKVIYWITEEAFDYLQDIVYFPKDVYRNIKYRLRMRFIERPWMFDTKLSRYEWCDTVHTMLCANFEALVTFVEEEKSHMLMWGASKEDREKYKKLSKREAGLEHLDWEISLGDEVPHQSEAAKEIKDLYLWWKDVYPNRPNVYDVTGWSDHCQKKREQGISVLDDCNETPEEQANIRSMLNNVRDIEEQYYQEEEDNLIRLMKIRRSLWT